MSKRSEKQSIKYKSRSGRHADAAMIRSALVIIVLWILFMPSYHPYEERTYDLFTVTLDGTVIGKVAAPETAERCLRMARRQLSREAAASGSKELVLTEADLQISGEQVYFAEINSNAEIVRSMVDVLRAHVQSAEDSGLTRSYTVKIRDYAVNVASKDDVLKLLNTALEQYDPEHRYTTELVLNTEKETGALTARVVSREEQKQSQLVQENPYPESGIETLLTSVMAKVKPLTNENSFEDFDLGLQELAFGDPVDIVEAYVPKREVMDTQLAIDAITKSKETNQIYEVQSGDVLSKIAEDFGLTLEELIAMNPTLDDENSMIRPQDELIVTVPKPVLAVTRSELIYYEEDYEAEVRYIDNDSWYTNQTKVITEPSSGHRRVVAEIHYSNDTETTREIIKEEITWPAVAKVVERGTIVPPSYIRPISGGRLSSGFGRRSRPKKGASTYHKGVDFATPVGTAVKASSGGVVARAGWGSGYGYCVYINHPDGKQTRYGHLSRVLVKAGQTVTQGQKIALSGNTGVSTGPHLHFEILVGGSQVNPLTYIGG